MSIHPVSAQLAAIRAELNASFFERGDAIESLLLGLVAGEHVMLLGPPGTSKSRLVRAVVSALDDASYFEVALSKTRPAEAVLGPLDIKSFRESGEYKLRRAGFATDVDVLFADELGKMSPVLGHDMLALLNERIYHEVNGGRSVHPAPLHVAFTASNEMPTGESDDAAALWDRLLLRVVVDYLQDKANFASLLTHDVADPIIRVSLPDIKKVAHDVLPTITLGETVVEGLVKLRMQFASEHLYPSDRRWRNSVKILRAAAFMAGRDAVTEDDLAVLRYTLWDTPEQISKVRELCLSAANPFVAQVSDILAGLREVESGLNSRGDRTDMERNEFGKEVNSKLRASRQALDNLLTEAKGRPIPDFKAASDLCINLDRRVLVDFLGTSEDVAEVVLQKRLGLGDGGNQ